MKMGRRRRKEDGEKEGKKPSNKLAWRLWRELERSREMKEGMEGEGGSEEEERKEKKGVKGRLFTKTRNRQNFRYI